MTLTTETSRPLALQQAWPIVMQSYSFCCRGRRPRNHEPPPLCMLHAYTLALLGL